MRRRLIDVGRIRRLPSRKMRIPEPSPGNTMLHVKLFCGWSVVVLLDLLVGFRLEYLYPAVMFIRSVLDSYKYQGLVFSLLFIILVLYLDILCWTILIGPWLFLIASSCVWLEMIRNWDHMFGYSSILLWMFFLYVEISQRMQFYSPSIVSFTRPFAAHCIGYPVITMSFLLKHQLIHILRQRQQKLVAEENANCFKILLKALPVPEEDGEESDHSSNTTTDEILSNDMIRGKGSSKGNKRDGSVKGAVTNGNKEKNGKQSGRSVGTGSVSSKRDPSPSFKLIDSKNSSLTNSSSNKTTEKLTRGTEVIILPVGQMSNGDLMRPSSAGKSQPPSGKKQALVKAVPRTDLQQQMEAREKAAKSNEVMLLELKEERQQRSLVEMEVTRLQKDIKRLQADLHASRLQEEEACQSNTVLMQQDRLNRMELQRIRHENETMHNRLSKMSSVKSRDMDTISSLEEQLRGETVAKQRIETQLREQRSQASSQNQWSKEEMREVKEKLSRKEKELTSMKENLQHMQQKYQEIQSKFMESKRENKLITEKCHQLQASLSDVTRVKIELFSYLSDATRKHESLVDELHKKNAEIERLKQKMQQLVALQSTWTPSLSPHH